MEPYLQDPDVMLYHGDVLDVLREMEAESVDCCVTSPPYWGLRDYGTGAWEGGDADCQHSVGGQVQDTKAPGAIVSGQRPGVDASTCRKCGATRIDQQLGLEPTPEQYVERMVEVFREVRRVLASHGTVFLNLGDSYANKQRQMMPARVALALQADGWWLRSEIVWSKRNPMPSSVTDRPTDAHEMVYLLSKQPRYFFDQEAVREAHASDALERTLNPRHGFGSGGGNGAHRTMHAFGAHVAGRNIRSVWEIATQPYAQAHFATFPEELARRCIAAGCPEQVCRVCGKARERVVESFRHDGFGHAVTTQYGEEGRHRDAALGARGSAKRHRTDRESFGLTDCDCGKDSSFHGFVMEAVTMSDETRAEIARGERLHPKYRPGIVLDPFMGSGTVAFVARKLGRHSVGIDLSAEYLALAAKRLSQQSLFA